MAIRVAEDEYEVAICDDHEDQASPKAIKTILEEKAKEIQQKNEELDKLKEMAEKLGMKLIPENQLVVPATPTKQPPKSSELLVVKEDAKIVDADVKIPQVKSEVSSTPDSGNVESYGSYRSKKLRSIKEAHQTIATSSRGPITIPSRILDVEGGRTNIKIAKTSDADLQRRTKMLADNDMQYRDGGQVRDCRMCSGTGISRIDPKKVCPKCEGDGFAKN